jgi:hypothetical protein
LGNPLDFILTPGQASTGCAVWRNISPETVPPCERLDHQRVPRHQLSDDAVRYAAMAGAFEMP